MNVLQSNPEFKEQLVQVTYYAILRDTAGKSHEVVLLRPQDSGRSLYSRLQDTYGFPVQLSHIRVAVNDQFVSVDDELNGGDRVVFIPPVQGG